MQKEQHRVNHSSLVQKAPIQFQVKLSESGDEANSQSDGASTPIEDDSGEYVDEKPIETGNNLNLNKKIYSIKNKYDDDRNKIKTTNI